MLSTARRILALISIIGITLLFADYTGTIHNYLGFIAKIQFLPALLAMNVLIIIALIGLSLLLGRIYCSVICPLGILQDVITRMGSRGKRKFRFSYSAEKKILRYSVFAIYAIAVIIGIPALVTILAPYSAFGRIAQTMLQPIYMGLCNILAYFDNKFELYMIYDADVYIKGVTTLIVAITTFIIISVLAWKNGRTYCNTICPVGTVLSFFSRFSLLKPVIDTTKCNSCGLCAKQCKASCINSKEHSIDYSRCVVCFNCLDNCKHNAISYTLRRKSTQKDNSDAPSANGKRAFIATGLTLATTLAAKSQVQEKIFDGGYAPARIKNKPNRKTELVPAGAISIKNVSDHCTACQLCVSACPNKVLEPSSDLATFMQPRMNFTKGYCRPECNVCSSVCPAGAIIKIEPEEKTSIKIGSAHWIENRCIVATDDVECGNCAYHCDAKAIKMITVEGKYNNRPVPHIDTDTCIGCGKCEYVCPSKDLAAIIVEGYDVHHIED